MNRAVVLSILAALILALAAYFLFHPPAASAPVSCSMNPQPTIVAIGDSLVAGYGAPQGQDFVSDLSGAVGAPIQNLGVSGNTTADGLARVQDVLANNPDIVIVLLGGNDALQKVPQETTKANLAKIIETLQSYQSKRVRVILVGVIGGFPTDPYAAMFSRLAKRYDVTYVPNILSGIITDRARMSDEVHPNAAGYSAIADRLRPILVKECQGK